MKYQGSRKLRMKGYLLRSDSFMSQVPSVLDSIRIYEFIGSYLCLGANQSHAISESFVDSLTERSLSTLASTCVYVLFVSLQVSSYPKRPNTANSDDFIGTSARSHGGGATSIVVLGARRRRDSLDLRPRPSLFFLLRQQWWVYPAMYPWRETPTTLRHARSRTPFMIAVSPSSTPLTSGPDCRYCSP